jgi:hypothetical protein
LESATRARSYASLKLVALRLQHCGPEQSNLLSLLSAADDLGVIEIADSEADYVR